MFLHQVIDDMVCGESCKECDETRKLLRVAQCFHLGEIGDSIKMLNAQTLLDVPFMGENASVRLPFGTCWFDWFQQTELNIVVEYPNTKRTMSISKGGALVVEMDPVTLCVIPFIYIEGIWRESDYRYLVSIGEKLNPLYKSLVVEKGDVRQKSDNGWVVKVGSFNTGKDFGDTTVTDIYITIVNFALKLLSCKNIETETIHPPRKLNATRSKKGKGPLVEYKVLNVSGKSARRSESSKTTRESSPCRVHICRGHFKTYTEDKPLFGKITGRWWWQPIVRGEAKQGVVIKEYNIKAGAK